MDGAWSDLESSGFSLTEKLRQEFRRPHHVFYLFDTVDECFEVVKGLHDFTVSLQDISQDSDLLFQWADNYRKVAEVERRLEFQEAKRCRLQEPRDPCAVDVYNELLGMDVKLQARLSRASYRLALAKPHMSRSDLESAARFLLPFWQFDGFFVVGLLRPDFTCVALIHHCGKKRGLAFCPSVLHFSFTFVFVSNSVFVWRLFCLGSALVILFPFRLFEKGQD